MTQTLAALIKSENAPLAAPEAEVYLAELVGGNKAFSELVQSPSLKAFLTGVLAGSPYLKHLLLINPERAFSILNNEPEAGFETILQNLKQATNAALAGEISEQEVRKTLRLAKQEFALLSALSDLGQVWPVTQVTRALTRFGDACLSCALACAQKWQFRDENPPELQNCGFVFLAMGKYGAFELNYSSDIDVIALFNPEAQIPDGKDAQTHFVKVTQKVVSLMQEPDENGYVFRTDLRLRPDPGATKVAISFPAALHYYETLGQNWERAAMIKARPCVGDIELGKEFLGHINPFIWRKYLDFAALQDIHAMKRQINAVKGFGSITALGHNLKLGRGGIREIEFFAQTQQLIAGGRNPKLRVSQTEQALQALYEQKWLDAETLHSQIKDYRALRILEHRVQMINDEQTHTLPKTSAAFESFAHFCGFQNSAELTQYVETILQRVADHYDDLFKMEESLSLPAGPLSFTGDSADQDTVQTFKNLGFEQPKEAVDLVRKWHYGRYRATQTTKSRERLTALTPTLITSFAESGAPDQAIANFDALLARLPAGLQLFGLLRVNPQFCKLLIMVLSLAPRLTETIIKRPHVVDAVLDPAFYTGFHGREDLSAALEDALKAARDYEDMLDRVRYFGQENKFMIGVLHLSNSEDSNEISRAYSNIAAVIIERLLQEVQKEFAKKHGVIEEARLAILGLGRLGAKTLTYESDLDIIILYDHKHDAGASNGAKPLDPVTYFTRLGQRFISALSAPTAAGSAYEVDMRLRPSGNAGPLATHFNSFKSYQISSAWTWEHLALTKASVIAGDASLGQQAQECINSVLLSDRDSAKVVADVEAMRSLLHLEKPAKTVLDVKNGQGGFMDVEFLSQSLTLLFAKQIKQLISSDPVVVLRASEQRGIINASDAEALINAYNAMQTLLQVSRLTLASLSSEDDLPPALQTYLATAFNLPDFSHLLLLVADLRLQVNEIVSRILPKLVHLSTQDFSEGRTHQSGEYQ